MTGAGVYVLLARSLHARAERHLREDAAEFRALVAHEAEEETEWSAIQVIEGAVREAIPLGWRVAVYDAAGAPVITSAQALRSRLDETMARGGDTPPDFLRPGSEGRYTLVGTREDDLRALAIPVRVHGTLFTAVVFRLRAEERQVLEQLGATFAVVFPLTLLLAGLAGYFLARRSLAPMAAMAREAERIGARTLGARLPTGGRQDEVGSLARVFNDLLARLDEAFSRQRRFMTDASHELRTPAAIMRGEAEVALSRSDRPSEEYRDSLGVVLGEAERLARIVDDLFTLSRADAGQHSLIEEEIYLDELLSECCRSFRAVAAARGVELHCEAPLEAPARGDPALLRRLFLNLLDNATRHTPAVGSVRLSLDAADGGYRVCVADTGSGIPADATPHIFERFFRADSARSRASGGDGAGLGLPIARWIAEAHGGRLELLHTGSDGTTFQVLLPRSGPPHLHATHAA